MNNKISKVVLKETAYIAAWTLIFSTLLQAVFLIIGQWDLTVLLGNLYSAAAVILNFFMLGLTVQKAVDKPQKDAQQFIKLSGTLRMLFLFVITVVGAILECFNIWTVVIPLFFPRAAIMLRPFFGKKLDNEPTPPVASDSAEAQTEDSETATDASSSADVTAESTDNNTEGDAGNE